MIEITEMDEFVKYFHKEQINEFMDHIELEINKPNHQKEISENYEIYKTGKKIYAGVNCYDNIMCIDKNVKNIIVEFNLIFKLSFPAITITRMTLYDEINDDFLDKVVDYKRVINK